MNLVNLTPHEITIEYLTCRSIYHPEGEDWHKKKRVIAPSGKVARVKVIETHEQQIIEQSPFDEWWSERIDIVSNQYGEIVDLPNPKADTKYIVSSLVLQAASAQGRKDCFAPNTAKAKRDKDGNIESVPSLVMASKKDKRSEIEGCIERYLQACTSVASWGESFTEDKTSRENLITALMKL